MSGPPVLKLVRIDEYICELTERGPNVDLTVRMALRKPAQRGTSGTFDLYLTSSYIRDIGPLDEPFRTLVVVAFDHYVGSLSGNAQDSKTELDGSALFNRLRDTAVRLNYKLAKGFYVGAH